MQKTQHLQLAVGVALVLIALNLGGASQAVADAVKDVIIANTAARPVPVTLPAGTTVGVSGAVSLTGTPSVNVVSLPTGQPFQHFGSFQISQPASFNSNEFTVPAGKRLVIEYVSLRSNIAPGGNQIVSYSVSTTGGGSLGSISFVPEKTVPGEFAVAHIASSELRAYADSGSTVSVGALRNGTTGSDTVSYTITGYLVDVP